MVGNLINFIASKAGQYSAVSLCAMQSWIDKLDAMRPHAMPLQKTTVKPVVPAKEDTKTLAEYDPVGAKLAKYQCAMTRIIPLEDGLGTLTLSIFESERRVERRLDLHDKKLVKKIGFSSHRFESMTVPDDVKASMTDYARAKSVQDTELFLNARIGGLTQPKAKLTPTLVFEKPIVAELPKLVQKVEVKPKEPEKVVVREAKEPGAAEKDKVSYMGRFYGAGFAPRTKTITKRDLNLPSNKGKKVGEVETFDQYFVKIEDSSLNYAINTIWGNDLERSVDEAKLHAGELIQITNHGRSPIEVQGRKVFKTNYEISRL